MKQHCVRLVIANVHLFLLLRIQTRIIHPKKWMNYIFLLCRIIEYKMHCTHLRTLVLACSNRFSNKHTPEQIIWKHNTKTLTNSYRLPCVSILVLSVVFVFDYFCVDRLIRFVLNNQTILELVPNTYWLFIAVFSNYSHLFPHIVLIGKRKKIKQLVLSIALF